MMQTVIPYWETDGKKLTKLEFLPLELIKNGNKSEEGLPVIAENPDFAALFAEISLPYGVKMTLDKNNILYGYSFTDSLEKIQFKKTGVL